MEHSATIGNLDSLHTPHSELRHEMPKEERNDRSVGDISWIIFKKWQGCTSTTLLPVSFD